MKGGRKIKTTLYIQQDQRRLAKKMKEISNKRRHRKIIAKAHKKCQVLKVLKLNKFYRRERNSKIELYLKRAKFVCNKMFWAWRKLYQTHFLWQYILWIKIHDVTWQIVTSRIRVSVSIHRCHPDVITILKKVCQVAMEEEKTYSSL